MLPKYPSKIRLCHCHAHGNDPLVKNDLAITPRQMFNMVQQGIPLSDSNAVSEQDFIEGYTKLDFEPPHIYTRHADIISSWNVQQDSRKQMLKVVGTPSLNPDGEEVA